MFCVLLLHYLIDKMEFYVLNCFQPEYGECFFNVSVSADVSMETYFFKR